MLITIAPLFVRFMQRRIFVSSESFECSFCVGFIRAKTKKEMYNWTNAIGIQIHTRTHIGTRLASANIVQNFALFTLFGFCGVL